MGFDRKGELVASEVWGASKRRIVEDALETLANEKREIVKALPKKKS